MSAESLSERSMMSMFHQNLEVVISTTIDGDVLMGGSRHNSGSGAGK